MSAVLVGIIGILFFLVLLLLGMPISFAMIITGFTGFSYLTSLSSATTILAQDIFSSFSSYSLAVIPMYMLMGFFAFYSGVGSRIFSFAYKAIGHWPGGLIIAAQAACAIFGAVCGSINATAATIGAISLPEMERYKYSTSISTASIAAGSTLGILIPPSIIFIIYGIATEQSIGKLFVAGIVPGLLLLVLFSITTYIYVSYNPEAGPRGPRSTWNERFRALGEGVWEVLLIFFISLTGLFMGWFTPAEAGAVGAAAVLLVTVPRGRLKWDGVRKSLSETTLIIAMIMLMVAAAIIFGKFMAVSQIPFELAEVVKELPLPRFMIMLMIVFIYLILGFFIDSLGMILLTIPIFYPVVVTTLGYDPIWFGVIIVMVVGIASITPPVGMTVYVVKGVVPHIPIQEIFRGIWPFLLTMIICVVTLIIFPGIVTFLPNLLF